MSKHNGSHPPSNGNGNGASLGHGDNDVPLPVNDGFPRPQKSKKGPPKIRRHNKERPYVKATQRQQAEIIEFVATLIVLQKTKHEIHREVDKRFRKTWSTTDQLYIPRAHKLLRERAAMSRDDARSLGVGVLLDVVRTGTNRERLGAVDQLAKIYGINAPTRTEVSGPGGGTIELETKSKDPFDFDGLRKLQEQELRGSLGGNGRG